MIHCAKCDWSQDNFWTENYNTIKSQVEGWNEIIAKAIDEKSPQRNVIIDRSVAVQKGMPFDIDRKGNAVVDVRDFLAKEIESMAKQVRHMHWLIEKDYLDDENKTCPVCGSAITID